VLALVPRAQILQTSALPCPEIGLEWFLFLFLVLGAVLMWVSVFSPVACCYAPNGLDAASTVYGETLLSFRFVGTHKLPS